MIKERNSIKVGPTLGPWGRRFRCDTSYIYTACLLILFPALLCASGQSGWRIEIENATAQHIERVLLGLPEEQPLKEWEEALEARYAALLAVIPDGYGSENSEYILGAFKVFLRRRQIQ